MPSATWPATRPFRKRREGDPPGALGVASFKLSLRFTRDPCSAGIIPKARAARSDTTKLTMKTRTFICRYAPESISDASLVMICAHHRVRMRATTPPKRNSNVLSVKSWRIIRPREEPRAVRTATSLWRFTPRARSRLPTLAHAIKSTIPAETAVIHKPRWAFCTVGGGWRNISAKSSTTSRWLRSARALGFLN